MVCSDCTPLFEQVRVLEELVGVKVEKLALRVAEQDRQIAKLKARLLLYENANTPPSRSRKQHPPREHSKNSLGAPEGHEGSTREKPEPDRVVDVEPLKRCRKCNALLGNPSGFIGQLITDLLLNPELLVTLFRLPVQTCKNCGSENVASHKDCPENGQFGYNIMALVSMLKHKGRLTYRKICWFFKNMFNMDFTPATALELDSRTASKVSGEYSKLVGNIRGSDYVNIDETGAKVNGEKGHYTWGFITKDTTLLVTRKSRGKNILEEILGINYVGIIICDGYKAYQNFTRFLQRCWAHILREIKYLAEDLPQAVPLYRELKTLYKWAVERYRKRMNKKQRRIMWIRAKYRLRIILSRYAKIKPLQKPLQKIHNGLDHWFTFILHPEIEPTNNIAERGIRETVVQRKIYGCLRNEKGTRNHDVLSSLIATWEQRGLNPYTQLQQTLRS